MAQLIITLIDQENGSVNTSFRLRDKDVQRIYNAIKHTFANDIIAHKTKMGEVLEASDTVDGISSTIDSQEVVNSLGNTFINELSAKIHNIEARMAYEKIADQIERIRVIEE